jgi:hypothetical protein
LHAVADQCAADARAELLDILGPRGTRHHSVRERTRTPTQPAERRPVGSPGTIKGAFGVGFGDLRVLTEPAERPGVGSIREQGGGWCIPA